MVDLNRIRLGQKSGYILPPASGIEVPSEWSGMFDGDDYIITSFDDMYVYDPNNQNWINHKEFDAVRDLKPITPSLSVLVGTQDITINPIDGTETIFPANIEANTYTHDGNIIANDRICTQFHSRGDTTILTFNDLFEPGEVWDYDADDEEEDEIHIILCEDKICTVSTDTADPSQTPNLEIPINSTDELTNYVLEVRLTLGQFGTGIPVSGLANSDYLNVQPMDEEDNLLDFSLQVDGDDGVFDIVIPSLPAGDSKIFLWQTETPTTPSNIEDIYVFVDNFTGIDETPPDNAKWTVTGTPHIVNAVEGGVLRLVPGDKIVSKGISTNNLTIRSRVIFNTLSTDGPKLNLVGKNDSGVYTAFYQVDEGYYPWLDPGHHNNITTIINGNTSRDEVHFRWWRFVLHDIMLRVNNAGTKVDVRNVNGESFSLTHSSANTTTCQIEMETWGEGGYGNELFVDYIKAQPYVENIPTIGTTYLNLPENVDEYITAIDETLSIVNQGDVVALTPRITATLEEESPVTFDWLGAAGEYDFCGWIGMGGSVQVDLTNEGHPTFLQYGHESGGWIIHNAVQETGSWKLRMRFDAEYTNRDDIAQHFSLMCVEGYSPEVTLKISNTYLTLYYWDGESATYIVEEVAIVPGDDYHIYEVIRNGDNWTVKMDDVTKGTGTLNPGFTPTAMGLHLLSAGYYGVYTDYVILSNPTLSIPCHGVITETNILLYTFNPLALLTTISIVGGIIKDVPPDAGTASPLTQRYPVILSDDSLRTLNINNGTISSLIKGGIRGAVHVPQNKVYAITDTKLVYILWDQEMTVQELDLPQNYPHYIAYYHESSGGQM